MMIVVSCSIAASVLTLGITSWFGFLRQKPAHTRNASGKNEALWLEGRLHRRELMLSSGTRSLCTVEVRGTYTVRACS